MEHGNLTEPPGGPEYPVIWCAETGERSLPEMLSNRSDAVVKTLDESGAVLFRGFAPDAPEHLDDLTRAMGSSPLKYEDAATPRTEVAGNVYTSTDYPAAEEIELHHEGCYSAAWPGYLYFGCVTAARTGGGTTVADARQVLSSLRPATLESFRQRGISYVRTFHPHLGMPWQKVFETDDPKKAESWCQQRGMQAEWVADGVLQTRQTWPATLHHPRTGEECWFNQAVAFHPSGLPDEVRRTMTRIVGAELLPKRVTYGDGGEIEEDLIEEVRQAYRSLVVPAPWEPGDVLILDNILMAHGREPYEGDRRILVAMSHGRSWQEFEGGETA